MAVSLTVIANVAIGVVGTIIVESAWRLLVEGRRYTLDLKRRFFDAKLAATLDSIREWRTAYDYTRAALRGIEHSLKLPSPLDQLYLQAMLAQGQRQMEEVQRATRNVSSTLDFFYGERVAATLKKMNSLNDAMLPHVTDLLDALMRLKFAHERMAEGATIQGLCEFEHAAREKAESSISAMLQGLEQMHDVISRSIEVFRADFRPYQDS